jgi:hypothetical protein
MPVTEMTSFVKDKVYSQHGPVLEMREQVTNILPKG